MLHRRPTLAQLPGDTGASLARLAGLEGFSRALLVGIAPLLALDALGSKAAVSHVYLLASLFTLSITLNLSTLERLIARRRVVTLGGVFLVVAAFLLYAGSGPAFALGLGMRSAAASIFSVCLSLYIMDHIGKGELTRTESRRMVYAGAAWLAGPSLGLWLYHSSEPFAPFVLSAICALAMVAYFWHLRLGPDRVIRAARSRAVNPLRAVARYLDQPRLRIAYGITLSRSCFWVALFVYGPIYVVEAGLPVWAAGALLSGASALLLLSPLVRRLADRYASRQIIVAGLLLTGSSMLGLAMLGPATAAGIALWITASLGGVALDVLGNIPFMRSVRPRERSEMTMVFSTWREGSELLTPAIAAVVSLVAPFWTLYAVLGLMHVASAFSATWLPRRL